VRIFKNTWFCKFARKEGISNAMLLQAIQDAENGKVDADYGGGVIKQRIARAHTGKSGGYRSIIFYTQGNKAFFVYGFAKNGQSNISTAEAQAFKKQAKLTLALSEQQLDKLLDNETYREVTEHE
jgi:hypothetical protein